MLVERRQMQRHHNKLKGRDVREKRPRLRSANDETGDHMESRAVVTRKPTATSRTGDTDTLKIRIKVDFPQGQYSARLLRATVRIVSTTLVLQRHDEHKTASRYSDQTSLILLAESRALIPRSNRRQLLSPAS